MTDTTRLVLTFVSHLQARVSDRRQIRLPNRWGRVQLRTGSGRPDLSREVRHRQAVPGEARVTESYRGQHNGDPREGGAVS